MFSKLILVTAITAAFAATPAFAADTGSQGERDTEAETTGQSRSVQAGDSGQADRQSPTGSTGDQADTTASNLDQRFNQLDLNQDGELDEDELSRYGSTAAGGSAESEGNKEQGERLLRLYDHDDNDVVTQQELEKGPKSKEAQEEDEGWW